MSPLPDLPTQTSASHKNYFNCTSLIFEKGKIDIGLCLEGSEKPDHTVEVSSLDIRLCDLRQLIATQCDNLDFKYKFINTVTKYCFPFFCTLL